MCNDLRVPTESARARSISQTRDRVLDAALDVLGRDADASMGDVAAAAGVVRRTLYGHFPARADLVRALTERAAAEIATVLAGVDGPEKAGDTMWADFVTRIWPLTDRYRVLVTLRRGEYSADIHAVLGSVDDALAGLVRRGQDAAVFGRHLPPDALGRLALSTVFAVAEGSRSGERFDARAATITSLLILGVTEDRARTLAAAWYG